MSPHAPRLTLGGDFELQELSLGNPDNLIKLTQGFQGSWTLSGRSALSLVIQDLILQGIGHLHLPAYLCDSVLAPVEALGLSYSFYEVDLDLVAHPPTEKSSDSAVLIIDYFGWPNPGLVELPDETPVIEDLCQAMLSSWPGKLTDRHYLIASPRKFGPTGLGGWCSLVREGSGPTKDAEAVLQLSLEARLLKGEYLAATNSTIDMNVEQDYLTSLSTVEEFLDTYPLESGIPESALKIISGVDWDFVTTQRRKNWLQLVALLPGEMTPVFSCLPESVVPLGLVVRVANRDRVRKKLAAERIFCPVHWPLPKQVDQERFPRSVELADTLLTLPIDQRYDESEMTRLAEALTLAVEASS